MKNTVISEELREYSKEHAAHNDFYASDLQSIYDIGNDTGEIYDVITAALKVGFVRGFKAATERQAV